MTQTRRTILRRASTAGLLGLLAGCTGDGDGEGDGTDTSTATESPMTAEPTSSAPTDTMDESESTQMGDGTTSGEGTGTMGEGTRTTAEETAMDQPTTTDSMDTPTSTPEPSEPTTVELEGFAFGPVRASIAPGETVRWVNRDNAEHNVTSAQFHDSAESWSFSRSLSGGASASQTFESPGVYEYYCTIHGESSMCGVILVGDVSLSNDLPCESDDDGPNYGLGIGASPADR
ncbi:MAG: plastocyanin [Halobacteriales archaeon]|jgi:plastocyanin